MTIEILNGNHENSELACKNIGFDYNLPVLQSQLFINEIVDDFSLSYIIKNFFGLEHCVSPYLKAIGPAVVGAMPICLSYLKYSNLGLHMAIDLHIDEYF